MFFFFTLLMDIQFLWLYENKTKVEDEENTKKALL